jgi:hypothetical protein
MKEDKQPRPGMDDLRDVISREVISKVKDPSKLPLSKFLAIWNSKLEKGWLRLVVVAVATNASLVLVKRMTPREKKFFFLTNTK